MNPRHSAMVLVAAASTIVASAAYLAPQAATAAGARHHAYPHHLTGTAKGFQQVDNAPKGDSMGDVIVDTFALARSGHSFTLAAINLTVVGFFGVELARYRPAAFLLLMATIVLFVDIVVNAGNYAETPSLTGTQTLKISGGAVTVTS